MTSISTQDTVTKTARLRGVDEVKTAPNLATFTTWATYWEELARKMVAAMGQGNYICVKCADGGYTRALNRKVGQSIPGCGRCHRCGHSVDNATATHFKDISEYCHHCNSFWFFVEHGYDGRHMGWGSYTLTDKCPEGAAMVYQDGPAAEECCISVGPPSAFCGCTKCKKAWAQP
jgi:hypothetical protein